MRYCPKCGSEYIDSAVRCADCDAALIDEQVWQALLEKRAAEDREEFVNLCTAQDRFEADVISDLLKKEHIPVLVRQYGDTSFDGIFIPQKGWAALCVPRDSLVRAERIVQEYQRYQSNDESDT